MKNGTGFAGRLSKLRIKQQFSKAGLARAVGVSTTAVINWEAGKTHPRPDALAAIAATLQTTEDYLAGGAAPAVGKRVAIPHATTQPTRAREGHTGISEAVHEARARIADMAGLRPDKVKIVLEY